MKYLFIILFLTFNANIFSQENSVDTLRKRKIPKPKVSEIISPYPYVKLEVKEPIDTINSYKRSEEYPEPFEFIPVEKHPALDLSKLQSLVLYPKIALDSKKEGNVIVKILISSKGDIVKHLIVNYSDEVFINAAIDAIKKYGKVEPALQNNKPIHCWISVPITFKLRPLEENKENE